MNRSESVNELFTALSAFQGEVRDVHKDRQGYGYKYADLEQVLTSVRPLLSKHGLSVTQIPGTADDKVSVETILGHKSGQWISGVIEMPVSIGKGMTHAQACGSVISYARRYSLTSWLGISQSDNDAAAETSVETPAEIARPNDVQANKNSLPPITEKVLAEIAKLAKGDQGLIKKMCDHFSVSKLTDLTLAQGYTAINKLSKAA